MFDDLLPLWIQNLEKSGVQKALHTATSSDLISFSLGRPDNQMLSLFSSPEFEGVSSGLFSSENLQYSIPSFELKNHVVGLMRERGVICRPEEILLTTGAQQAMNLLVKLFVCEGDTILVDQLTYPGFTQIAQARQARLVPIPVCYGGGFDQEAFENILKSAERPRLI